MIPTPGQPKKHYGLGAVNYHSGETEVLFKRRVKERDYLMDFAICCARGKPAVETDGDYWHASPAKAELDKLRYNDLESAGWQQLRFTENQIKEQIAAYCIPKIVRRSNSWAR